MQTHSPWHSGRTFDVHPDGKLGGAIERPSGDNSSVTIPFFDTTTGQRVANYVFQAKRTQGDVCVQVTLRFSPDGKWLAAAVSLRQGKHGWLVLIPCDTIPLDGKVYSTRVELPEP